MLANGNPKLAGHTAVLIKVVTVVIGVPEACGLAAANWTSCVAESTAPRSRDLILRDCSNLDA